jgi:hypothetical protein
MAIVGQDRFENLSHAGGPHARPPVRFGDHVVPAAVAWVRNPAGRDPGVRAEFEMRKEGPVCTSVTLRMSTKGRPITTSDLATLPGLDRMASDAFKALAFRVFDDEDWRAGRNLGRSEAIFRPDPRDLGASLRARSDDELAAVARVYRENIDDAPVEAVVDAFNYSRSTADRRISAARKRGFLPETTRGKRKA